MVPSILYTHFLYYQVREETYLAFEQIYPVLTEFRKNQQWYGHDFFILLLFTIYADCYNFNESQLLSY